MASVTEIGVDATIAAVLLELDFTLDNFGKSPVEHIVGSHRTVTCG